MSFDIKHIARLARLTLTPKEEKKYYREIGNIVRYVDQLAKANVSKEEATTRLNESIASLRDDDVIACADDEKTLALNAAPRRKGKLIVVPRIFES